MFSVIWGKSCYPTAADVYEFVLVFVVVHLLSPQRAASLPPEIRYMQAAVSILRIQLSVLTTPTMSILTQHMGG